MRYLSPLIPWLNRENSLPDFSFLEFGTPEFNTGGFLALDVCYPIHEVTKHPSKSLGQTWIEVREYIRSALEIIDSDSPGWLDSEEVEMIKEELPNPPVRSYPIYIVTVGEKTEERIVYIGKTSSNANRFLGGHSVALKLHHPDYNNLRKRVYFCCVVFLMNKEYLPLEWVSPIETAESILDSVESQLIYTFKPELNTQKKGRNYSKHPINLHIQNFTDSKLLNDKFIRS
ncbi:hypothetical protein [Brevibacillus laterosporus]|uniref:hypothetical protein n=1 Tax=Brevibacillus laterosporus TaxID=1465 RepID=UPI003D236B63